MSSKKAVHFESPLNDFGDIMRVSFEKDGAKIVGFTVQYEMVFDGQLQPVVRYDTAHGFAHRDHLLKDGETQRWDRMAEQTSYRESLTEAMSDIRSNWERYRSDFIRRNTK